MTLRSVAWGNLKHVYELVRTTPSRAMETVGIVWEYELEFEGLRCVEYSMNTQHDMECHRVWRS